MRALGVCLGAVTVSDGLDVRRTLDLASRACDDGFHPMELSCRWTIGSARLLPALWRGCQGLFFLTVDLANTAPPRWIAPDADAVETRRRA